MTAYDPSADYDLDGQEATLRLIIARCPDLAADAATALRVPGGATRQTRLDRLIPRALQDAQAWTADERQQLAGMMWTAGEPLARAPQRRTELIRVRVTPEEETWLKATAQAAGLTVSDLIRRRVFERQHEASP